MALHIHYEVFLNDDHIISLPFVYRCVIPMPEGSSKLREVISGIIR